MSENNTQVVSTENNTEQESWDRLIEYHKGIRDLLFNITENFAKVKAYILGKGYEDEELNELMKGIEESLREVAKDVDLITKAHGKIEERDGKKVLLLKSGPVNIDDSKEVEIFINTAQAYLALYNKLIAIATTSIMTVMSKVTELDGGSKEELEELMSKLQTMTNGGNNNGEQQQ